MPVLSDEDADSAQAAAEGLLKLPATLWGEKGVQGVTEAGARAGAKRAMIAAHKHRALHGGGGEAEAEKAVVALQALDAAVAAEVRAARSAAARCKAPGGGVEEGGKPLK